MGKRRRFNRYVVVASFLLMGIVLGLFLAFTNRSLQTDVSPRFRKGSLFSAYPYQSQGSILTSKARSTPQGGLVHIAYANRSVELTLPFANQAMAVEDHQLVMQGKGGVSARYEMGVNPNQRRDHLNPETQDPCV
jgi:hypothetical protein